MFALTPTVSVAPDGRATRANPGHRAPGGHPADSHEERAQGLPVTERLASGPRRPIIVADDDEDLRRVMQDVLTDAGFFVFVAANANEVLDIVGQGVRPCLVVCDLLMPGMPVDQLVAASRKGGQK